MIIIFHLFDFVIASKHSFGSDCEEKGFDSIDFHEFFMELEDKKEKCWVFVVWKQCELKF